MNLRWSLVPTLKSKWLFQFKKKLKLLKLSSIFLTHWPNKPTLLTQNLKSIHILWLLHFSTHKNISATCATDAKALSTLLSEWEMVTWLLAWQGFLSKSLHLHWTVNFLLESNKSTEHGHSDLSLKENTSEPVMMESQSIGKPTLVHGKDGTCKDTEITFMFKVPNSNTTIG